jgi:hypothetical protein
MWMDTYVQDTLIRAQIAEAQRDAALRHLLRLVKPPRSRARFGSIMRRLGHAASVPWLAQLIERMASS